MITSCVQSPFKKSTLIIFFLALCVVESRAAKFTHNSKYQLIVIEFSDLITALARDLIVGRKEFVLPGGLKHLLFIPLPTCLA